MSFLSTLALTFPRSKFLPTCLLALSAFLNVQASAKAATEAASDAALCPAAATAEAAGPAKRRIEEEKFVRIGGIEQWVTIHGSGCDHPVILFLHGGPGNPISPYADNIYGAWEHDFTLVQWDQRGAGRTYGRNTVKQQGPAREPEFEPGALSVERMAQDGIELAAYLKERLHQKKIILFGGSWSSVLGVVMAKSRPDLFYAYVGTGQIVSYNENQSASYRRVLALAGAAGDAKTLDAMNVLGAPPWSNPRAFGILRRATRIYEAKATTPAPSAWWRAAPLYATAQAQADYEAGEDFSYLQFVGLKGDGMLSRIDLPGLGMHFDVPVFLLQGREDLVTMPDVAQRYFERIDAPQKAFILLPRVGHDPNADMVDAQFKLLRERILPLTESAR